MCTGIDGIKRRRATGTNEPETAVASVERRCVIDESPGGSTKEEGPKTRVTGLGHGKGTSLWILRTVTRR